MQKNSFAIIIPAYNPPEDLLIFIEKLLKSGQKKIVIINDGSAESYKNIFDTLQKKEHLCLLSHPVNMGKGQALKTGFNFCLNNFNDISGVITADADGQHTLKDVLNLASNLSNEKNELILGARAFDSDVPMRSKVGNIVTKKIFSLITGQKISDTQTGLRGIPYKILPSLLELQGNRYEYEMNMLLNSKKMGLKIKEIPISTIYIEKNQSSHFNPLKDSFKIYFLLIRFISSSLLSALADFIIFLGIYTITKKTIYAVYASRLLVSGLNFTLNKKFVFKSDKNFPYEAASFYFLICITAAFSFMLTSTISNYINCKIWTAKLVADLLLFPATFKIQRDYIFKKEKK